MKLSQATPGLIIKLASLAVHAEEFLANQNVNPPASWFDAEAIKGMLNDSEVRSFLDDPNNAVLLPVKRSER